MSALNLDQENHCYTVNLVCTLFFFFVYLRILLLIIVSCPSDQRTEQSRLPNSARLTDMCIITKSDLNRIYDNLDRRQREKDAVRQEIERKKELLERSAQITKDWPNTIAVSEVRNAQNLFKFFRLG